MRRVGKIRELAACVCVMAVFFMVSSAGAQAATPVWSITQTSYPTNFPPGSTDTIEAGPAFLITATNVGDGATSGPFTVTDTLPAGLSVSPALEPAGRFGREKARSSMQCSVAASTVTCTGSTPAVGPGEGLFVEIPLQVSASAPASVTNVVTISGGGAAPAQAQGVTAISALSPAFDFLPGTAGLFAAVNAVDGSAVTQAGAHPYGLTVSLGFPILPGEPGKTNLYSPGGGVRDASATLPQGLVVNPGATEKCKEAQLEVGGCPEGSQVGTVTTLLSTGQTRPTTAPLFNMKAAPGTPGEFGVEPGGLEGTYVHIRGRVLSDGEYRLAARTENIPAKVGLFTIQVSLWGIPSEESHDGQRGECFIYGVGGHSKESCPVTRTHRPFVTMPSACSSSLDFHASADGWIAPTAVVGREATVTDLLGNPIGVEGCNRLDFEPTISARPTTNQGESPSGLAFDLHQTLHEVADELATANLKNTTVTLPEGFVLNPAAAGGRDACSSAQLGVTTGVGVTPIRYLEEPAHCPAASKLGTAEVTTPLLDGPLRGSVYLAKPFDNPFGSLLGIYLVIDDEETGVIAKLVGKVIADERTGELTTTFEESPDLPLEDVKLDLFEGPRAALTTPLVCGTRATSSTLTPWSTPEGADAHPSDSFETTAGCSASEAQAPKDASFTAGTVSPLSGAYSPFVLRLSRKDGTQHITGIETTLPAGLLGKLAGVSYCPESGIAQATSREKPEQGKLEQSSSSCPASSEVGTVQVTAGSGSSPIPVSGHAYLAGPYRGAPLSLVVIVPAVAGPFDLGTVVDRVALKVGEYDARIHAVADPLPTIRDGIPLDVRSIELKLDRPSFTLNPTSCEAMQIEGQVSTQAGQTQSLTNRFQVGECGRLAFKPKLQISLKGPTKRTGHPALKAVVTYPKQGAYANIARAQVNLPHSEFLDQGNIGKACTKVLLAQEACPAKSIYGKAKAWTPLLDKPLEGPVYLVGGYGYKLPALVAELKGQIRVLLVGKVDTGKNKGIRNTFEAVPDAPVERFVLEMKGGKKYGLLENSENVCKKKQVAGTAFKAQNGRTLQLKTRIANSCKSGSRRSGKRSHKKH